MRGGSVASNAVVQKVPTQSFDMLTKNFSNYTNSAACKSGGCPCTRKAKCGAHACKPKRGGNPILNVSQSVSNAVRSALSRGSTGGFDVFRSAPAPAGFEYANLRGNSGARSGGSGTGLKNMSEYMSNANSYTVRNRRGGASSTAGYAGLTYDIKSAAPVNASNRSTPAQVDRLFSNFSPSDVGSIDKIATYGRVVDATHPFSYSGAKDAAFGGKWKKAAPKPKAAPKRKPAKKAKAPKH